MVECPRCGIQRQFSQGYFASKHPMYSNNEGRLLVCKDCVNNQYEMYAGALEDRVLAFLLMACRNGWYFCSDIFKKVDNGERLDFGAYNQDTNRNGTPYINKSFEDSVMDGRLHEFITLRKASKKIINDTDESSVMVEDYVKNKESVVRSIGYDPFVHDNENDKAYLYWMLENMLDEATLEDQFKLPCVIQIVKNFGQIESLNKKINALLAKPTGNNKDLKSMIDAKSTLHARTLNLAKENGISVINSTVKSKGAGTLSGKIREMQEIGLEEILVNMFDIETGEAMKQVAEMSISAIYNNLRLDENDYTNIITEQRKMIEQKDTDIAELEENNRKLRVKMAKYEAGGEKL